ncbi:MAG TPA: tripartite tricarboxylate transporter TctB family protein [Burkholderiales bacterium]|nr:tripartite tricarboxylate transporter TctB family protein [Burkholderiales bacterium]
MLNRPALILGLLIMAVSAYAAIGALAWPLKTRLFPLVISAPVFVLATIEVLMVWLEGARFSQTKDFQRPPAEVPSSVAAPRSLRAAGWILGFFAAILLFGFLVAVPLFVFLYLKLQSRESWLFSALFTAAVGAVFYGLFDYALHLPFASGVLF